jgi:hypothetical protein
MDLYEEWNENRTKVPPGKYLLKCIAAGKRKVWHEGQGGWGRSEKIILWFEIIEGEHLGKVVPMFLPLGRNGRVPQGCKYFICWCIANGLRKPKRARLKEMPPSKFKDKVFEGEVVDVKPRWNTGREQPELFQYSRIDILYELVIGDPNS